MRWTPAIAFASLLGLAFVAALAAAPVTPDAHAAPAAPVPVRTDDVRFGVLRLLIESPAPLAAWQVSLEPTRGERAPRIRIVGVEGGTAAPFAEPPYFDPAAIHGDRLVTGAFSLLPARELPTGRVHVATVHLELRGAGDAASAFDAVLVAAADAEGRRLDARVLLDSGARP